MNLQKKAIGLIAIAGVMAIGGYGAATRTPAKAGLPIKMAAAQPQVAAANPEPTTNGGILVNPPSPVGVSGNASAVTNASAGTTRSQVLHVRNSDSAGVLGAARALSGHNEAIAAAQSILGSAVSGTSLHMVARLNTFGTFRAAMEASTGTQIPSDPAMPDTSKVWVVTETGQNIVDNGRQAGYATLVLDPSNSAVVMIALPSPTADSASVTGMPDLDSAADD